MLDYKKIARDTVIVYLFSYIAIFFSYFTRALYARKLDIVDYGLFFGLFSIFLIFTFLRDWGLGSATIFYTRKYIVKKDFSKVKTLYFLSHGFTFIMSLIIAVILFLVKEIIITAVYRNEGHISFIFNVFILFWIMETVYKTNNVFFESFHEQRQSRFNELLLRILIFVLSYLGFSYLHVYEVPVVVYLLATIAVSLFSIVWFYFKHNDVFRAPFYLGKDLFKEVFKYGSYMILGGISAVLLLSVDTFLIQVIVGAEEVGYYVSGLSAAQILPLVLLQLTFIITPLFAKLWHENNVSELSNIVNFLFNNLLIFILPLAAFFFVFAPNVIFFIFGAGFESSEIILQIFCFVMIVKMTNQILEQLMLATGQPGKSSIITLSGLVVNIILNVILISLYGGLGAAVATGISFSLIMVLFITMLRKTIKFKFLFLDNLKVLISTFFFIGVGFLMKERIAIFDFGNININFLINGGFIFLLSLAVYVGSLFFFGVITKEKIKLIKNLFSLKGIKGFRDL
ncbi:polysaccharide biosynthesis C-terminal domain-containing protein [Nanoarchaeota archaeon]